MTSDDHGLSSAVQRPEPRPFAVGWFRLLYVACIVALSVQTMVVAKGVLDHHFWLAALEIVGALLLLVATLQRIGLVILLAVYTVAALITIHAGHLPIYLALYAGTAVFLVQRGL
jgi:hypothetical protein